MIYVEISGANGAGVAEIAAPIWDSLSPCGQVLAIHEAARHVTAGRPFNILRVRRESRP